MTSTNPRHSSGGQAGFGLVLAIAVCAASVFLWAEVQAAPLAVAPLGGPDSAIGSVPNARD